MESNRRDVIENCAWCKRPANGVPVFDEDGTTYCSGDCWLEAQTDRISTEVCDDNHERETNRTPIARIPETSPPVGSPGVLEGNTSTHSSVSSEDV